MQLKKIKFTQISSSENLSDNIIYKCNFCQKNIEINKEKKQILEKLSGDGFFCTFCLRNNYQTQNSKHVLILTFCSVFGYYYLNLYKNKKMYLSEVEDLVKSHEKIGLKNPIFKYDPQSMLWFIDFSRVGKGKKKIPLREINITIKEIIESFKKINYNVDKFNKKYEEAIKKFYETRCRPNNRKILIPTMHGCVDNSEKISFEETKKFNFFEQL